VAKNVQFVIPSRGRADVIGQKALRIFPDAVVCVGDNEVEAYSVCVRATPSGN